MVFMSFFVVGVFIATICLLLGQLQIARDSKELYDDAMRMVDFHKRLSEPTREQVLEKEVARLQAENAKLAIEANKTEYR